MHVGGERAAQRLLNHCRVVMPSRAKSLGSVSPLPLATQSAPDSRLRPASPIHLWGGSWRMLDLQNGYILYDQRSSFLTYLLIHSSLVLTNLYFPQLPDCPAHIAWYLLHSFHVSTLPIPNRQVSYRTVMELLANYNRCANGDGDPSWYRTLVPAGTVQARIHVTSLHPG